MRIGHRILLLGAIVIGLLPLNRPASAGPMEDVSLGGAVFTGPTSAHASSFFVNPAALGLSGRGSHIYVGGSAKLEQRTVARQVIAPNGSQGAGPSVSDTILSPGGLIAWYSSFLDNNARLGIAFFTPTTQKFSRGKEALGYQSAGGHIVQSMLTLAGSYRIGGRFFLGIGVSLGYTSLRLKFNRDTALAGGSNSGSGIRSNCGGLPCGYENPLARESYDIRTGIKATPGGIFAIKNFSASLGLAYRLPGDSWVGLGYVALPGAFGTLSLPGTATIKHSAQDGGAQEALLADVGVRMAQMVFLGYRRPILQRFDLIADVRWQDLSRHSQFDIRLFGGPLSSDIPEWMPRYRGMRDVWRVALGIESNDTQRTRFGARLRYESSPANKDSSNALVIANNNATLATGAEVRIADQWVVGLGYEITYFPTTTVGKSNFDPRQAVACVDSQYDFDACRATREGRALSSAAGTYKSLRHGLLLSLRYDTL